MERSREGPVRELRPGSEVATLRKGSTGSGRAEAVTLQGRLAVRAIDGHSQGGLPRSPTIRLATVPYCAGPRWSGGAGNSPARGARAGSHLGCRRAVADRANGRGPGRGALGPDRCLGVSAGHARRPLLGRLARAPPRGAASGDRSTCRSGRIRPLSGEIRCRNPAAPQGATHSGPVAGVRGDSAAIVGPGIANTRRRVAPPWRARGCGGLVRAIAPTANRDRGRPDDVPDSLGGSRRDAKVGSARASASTGPGSGGHPPRNSRSPSVTGRRGTPSSHGRGAARRRARALRSRSMEGAICSRPVLHRAPQGTLASLRGEPFESGESVDLRGHDARARL
jgi:hypothetical protein